MLPQMNLKVGPGVIFLVAALEFAVELVDVLMCFLVVPQNPFLSELGLAALVRADELLVFVLLVGCEVVRQVLRHFETFLAAGKIALIESYRQMTFEVLPQLRVFMEVLVTVDDGALEVNVAQDREVLLHAYHILVEELLLFKRDEVLILGLDLIFVLEVQQLFVIVYLELYRKNKWLQNILRGINLRKFKTDLSLLLLEVGLLFLDLTEKDMLHLE